MLVVKNCKEKNTWMGLHTTVQQQQKKSERKK